MIKRPLRQPNWRASRNLPLIDTDRPWRIADSQPKQSLKGSWYYIAFNDDFSI